MHHTSLDDAQGTLWTLKVCPAVQCKLDPGESHILGFNKLNPTKMFLHALDRKATCLSFLLTLKCQMLEARQHVTHFEFQNLGDRGRQSSELKATLGYRRLTQKQIQVVVIHIFNPRTRKSHTFNQSIRVEYMMVGGRGSVLSL